MLKDENELERYLAEFRPREVRLLEFRQVGKSAWVGRLAAAAVVVISASVSLWYTGHEKKMDRGEVVKTLHLGGRVEKQRSNTILLTKLALEDAKLFAEQMDEQSRRVLPELHGQESMLSVLAKE
jgi:hypothetical protein